MDETSQPTPAQLQSVLARLAELSPRGRTAPRFRAREHAESVIAANQAVLPGLNLSPVWAIDRDDPSKCDVVGWTLTGPLN